MSSCSNQAASSYTNSNDESYYEQFSSSEASSNYDISNNSFSEGSDSFYDSSPNASSSSEAIKDSEESMIYLAEEYVLSRYLDPLYYINFQEIVFIVKHEYSTPEYQYSPENLLPESLNGSCSYFKDASGIDGYVNLSFDVNNDGKERYLFIILLNQYLLIKDYLDLLEWAKKQDYLYFVYGHRPSGGGIIPSTYIIPNEVKPVEKSMVNKSMFIFDYNHNGLNGYYNEFNICLLHQISGLAELKKNEIFLSFHENEMLTFKKIDDNSLIQDLDRKLPEEAEKTNRDWYKVVFKYKFEAQYALQLYKELELNRAIFYVDSSLCLDDSIESKVPDYHVYN